MSEAEGAYQHMIILQQERAVPHAVEAARLTWHAAVQAWALKRIVVGLAQEKVVADE